MSHSTSTYVSQFSNETVFLIVAVYQYKQLLTPEQGLPGVSHSTNTGTVTGAGEVKMSLCFTLFHSK
jgi:uncharacterized PurR-regulated membrane protein YhhQ (DUF165 family)